MTEHVRIHLSYFHEYHMRRDMPDVAAQYDGLHQERSALAAKVSAAKEALDRHDAVIEDLIAGQRLKRLKKPMDYDPAAYRLFVEQMRSGTYRVRDYLDMSAAEKKTTALKSDLLDLIGKVRQRDE